MKTIKTSDLTGVALDLAVATLECDEGWLARHMHLLPTMPFSSDWAQGGPIIEREGIEVVRGNDLIFPKGNEKGEYSEPLWLASYGAGRKFHGPTPLIAAMRCYVANKLGDKVEIPEELANDFRARTLSPSSRRAK